MTRPNLAVHAANCNVTEKLSAICSCGASEQVATERFTLHIPQDVLSDVASLAQRERRTISGQIVHILQAALDAPKRQAQMIQIQDDLKKAMP